MKPKCKSNHLQNNLPDMAIFQNYFNLSNEIVTVCKACSSLIFSCCNDVIPLLHTINSFSFLSVYFKEQGKVSTDYHVWTAWYTKER